MHYRGIENMANIRQIDFAGAELFVHAEGDWRGFRSRACAKEPETASWLRDVIADGTVFFDIGACVGSYSLIAASLGATVHAFEPVAVNYAQLQRNLWLNRTVGTSAWPIALASQNGPVIINLSSTNPGAASHDVWPNTATRASHDTGPTQVAMGMKLDDFSGMFGLPAARHIKIDVDGGEVDVLEGARASLRTVRSVMIETDATRLPDVSAILNGAGLVKTGSWERSGGQRNHLFQRR